MRKVLKKWYLNVCYYFADKVYGELKKEALRHKTDGQKQFALDFLMRREEKEFIDDTALSTPEAIDFIESHAPMIDLLEEFFARGGAGVLKTVVAKQSSMTFNKDYAQGFQSAMQCLQILAEVSYKVKNLTTT